MRFLSPTFHGFVDYAAAIALIAAPIFILPADAPTIAIWLSKIAGGALIVYSLLTDYSASIRNAIPFKLHLAIDFIAGAAFIAAPFVLGFEGVTKLYYLVMGVAIVLVVLVTNPNTRTEAEM